MERKIINFTKRLHPSRLSDLAKYLLKDEAISGKFIIGATILALIAANTALRGTYEAFWHTDLTIGLGNWSLDKDLRHWVDEGLMAIFFLVVGLELKRELVHGELKKFKTAALPFAAALGGMIVPAMIYLAFNMSSDAARGWAIPMATDIAFAIGILALLGKRIPPAIRLFLLTLAIVDDIGAVIVIALFYTTGINLSALVTAVALCALIALLGRSRRLNMTIFIVLGLLVWLAVNASAAHASIAGAIVGLLAPVSALPTRAAIAERLERYMIPVSTFIVVPLFAFANTGVVLSLESFQNPLAIPIATGIVAGLVIGKVIGIVGSCWLMTRLKFADLPTGSNWSHIVGVGFLAGIGFTVSIFVTELAFKSEEFITVSKLSIFAASAISGAIGLLILRFWNSTKELASSN